LLRSTVVCDGLIGCDSSPVTVLFEGCTQTECSMTRTDGVWAGAHAVVLESSGVWMARFADIGVTCEDQRNTASFEVRLTVSAKEVVNGSPTATGLIGSYAYQAATNPPTCSAGRAEFSISGSRS
jgi:hypothetical protein